jgi:hypothetical protein
MWQTKFIGYKYVPNKLPIIEAYFHTLAYFIKVKCYILSRNEFHKPIKEGTLATEQTWISH